MLETQVLIALQSLFEALNADAPSLPPEARAKVEAEAKRIAGARSGIAAEMMR